MKRGCGLRRAGTLELQLAHHRLAPAMHEILLEIEPAHIGEQPRPHRIVAHRHDRGANAHPPAQIGGDGGQAFARLQPPRSFHMQSDIAIAEAEPGLAAERLHRFHERPGFVVPAPAKFAIGQPGQRIGDGIDIGRNRQAEMLEIVAGVDDDQQVLGRHDARQAQSELGAADAAGRDHGR